MTNDDAADVSDSAALAGGEADADAAVLSGPSVSAQGASAHGAAAQSAHPQNADDDEGDESDRSRPRTRSMAKNAAEGKPTPKKRNLNTASKADLVERVYELEVELEERQELFEGDLALAQSSEELYRRGMDEMREQHDREMGEMREKHAKTVEVLEKRLELEVKKRLVAEEKLALDKVRNDLKELKMERAVEEFLKMPEEQ